jgi:hypothetical protein
MNFEHLRVRKEGKGAGSGRYACAENVSTHSDFGIDPVISKVIWALGHGSDGDAN